MKFPRGVRHFAIDSATYGKGRTAVVERVNRTVQERLREITQVYTGKSGGGWLDLVALVTKDYNTRKHSNLGSSPLIVLDGHTLPNFALYKHFYVDKVKVGDTWRHLRSAL